MNQLELHHARVNLSMKCFFFHLESTKVLLEDVPDLGRHPPSLGAVLGGELLPAGPVLHDPWRSKCHAHGGGLQTYSGLARQW